MTEPLSPSPAPAAPPPSAPPRHVRAASHVLRLGALAVVLAVSVRHVFDLDRFFVPKELALHATALLAGLLLFRDIRASIGSKIDRLLILFLGLSALSALFATNGWVAARAVAITASSIVVFWAARVVRSAGRGDVVLRGVAFAVMFAAFTSLLQAYGVLIDMFAVNRAPGGTLGNRNFIGHAVAFGLPMILLVALRARRFGFAALGFAMTVAALVLTRSRAAWLATAAVLAIFGLAVLFTRTLRSDRTLWRRTFALAFVAVLAGGAAILLPNALKWRADNPYLESVQGVAAYKEGSGHGRLVQYRQSLKMTLFHPLLGVGPGNWPVLYPKYAAHDDPSLDNGDNGMTSNPWPSSDWIAFISERGPLAAGVLAVALLLLAHRALLQLRTAATFDEALHAAALLGVLAGAGIAGAFDAVLLLGFPATIVWAALGALAPVAPEAPSRRFALAPALILVIVAIGATRSTLQLAAMEIYATESGRGAMTRASTLDPGSYRIHLRLARSGNRKQRCEHARAAHELYPQAELAKRLARGCGE